MVQGKQDTLLELPEPIARVVESDGIANPVARVLLNVSLAHLDYPLDYLVPPKLNSKIQPGGLVKVKLAGRDETAWVIERTSTTTHQGNLSPIRSVVSSVSLLTPTIYELAKAVAHRYIGITNDVLRQAIPPRHARTEKELLAEGVPPTLKPPQVDSAVWSHYPAGKALLTRLCSGESPRAIWNALPGSTDVTRDWGRCLVEAAVATLSSGRTALIVAPTKKHVDYLKEVAQNRGLGSILAELRADMSVAQRYREFLRALKGQARLVIGTRSAAFAPLPDLGLVACWDDGDDNYQERRAPYQHARQVLLLRADLEKTAVLVGGFVRTCEGEALVRAGWAASLVAQRDTVRALTPRIAAPTDLDLEKEGASGFMRIPSLAHRMVKDALLQGPVLVQVPTAGYVPALVCARCHAVARCSECAGPIQMNRQGFKSCKWCGKAMTKYHCPSCAGTQLRAMRIGGMRTGEELGREFPRTRVVVSGADHIMVPQVDESPRLVVATPGSEPVADKGYAAGLILDAAAISGRPELWAPMEAMRRWANAAALVAPESPVMILGQPDPVTAQALVRWDPTGFAERSLDERELLDFTPAVRVISVDGAEADLVDFLQVLSLPEGAEILGPHGISDDVYRAIIRAPHESSAQLSQALLDLQGQRSAHRRSKLKIQVEPRDLW